MPSRETTAGLLPNDTFVPFSNGFEYRMWIDNNCARGKGGCRNYNPGPARHDMTARSDT